MKRSEMILKIACYLNGACGMSNECCDFHAEGILEEIEKLGMKPPPMFRVKLTKLHNLSDHTEASAEEVFEWEKE